MKIIQEIKKWFSYFRVLLRLTWRGGEFAFLKSETFAEAQNIASRYGGNIVPKRSEK